MQNLVILANSGRAKAALKEAKQFEKSYPRDPALKNLIGVVYANMEMKISPKKFQKAIKNNSSFIPAYKFSWCFFQKCEYLDAIKRLNKP